MGKKKKISAELENDKITNAIDLQAATEPIYEGAATYKIIFNNKPIEIKKHNSGTVALQKAFALLMSNNISQAASLIPMYLDIRGTSGTSWLYNPAAITGSRYENLSGSWVTVLNAVIDTNNVKTTGLGQTVYMYLLAADGTTPIAQLTVAADETINLIGNNVSGLITWIMRLRLE